MEGLQVDNLCMRLDFHQDIMFNHLLMHLQTLILKVQVLQYMAQHQVSARPAAAHFGIGSMTTILQWQKLYNEGGITELANRQRGQSPMSRFNIKALLKKPISEITPAEMRRRLEYAQA